MNHQTFISLLLFFLYTCTNSCHDNEREALFSFKSSLKDPSNRLASWRGNNCCKWHGILCSNHSLHIISINLRNPNIESLIMNSNSKLVSTSNSTSNTAIDGTISPSLFTLGHLTYLDLSFNNFMYSYIPNGLSNLTRLTYLNLANSMFQGSLTTQLTNLTSLRVLDLSCSYEILDTSAFSYNLASSRAVLVGSTSTYVSFGSVSSSDLNWLFGLHNLRVLKLSGGDLSEATHVSKWAKPMSNLYELRSIELSNCKINGRIPIFELLNLTSLVSLVMADNFLNSPIPNQLANLTSISTLDLSGSNLLGTVPNLPQIRNLFLGTNPNLTVDLSSIFGVLPWPHLEALDIQMTQVSQSLKPELFANASSLVAFSASNCSIEGSIPSSLYNLSKLEILDLNFNQITGTLSESISNLKSLLYLSLFENYLGGPIPYSICKVSNLQFIHLGGNSITGTVPECIVELANLTVFYVAGNNMSGIIPSLTALFQNATPNAIGLGFSGLTVKVDQNPFPQTFQPRILELSWCKIAGQIPIFISQLMKVEFINLAHNNLVGTIPSWLFNLPKLGFLDLSYNNLHGQVPPTLHLQSVFLPTTLNLGHNNLEGTIPQLPNTIEVVDLSSNNFTDLPTQTKGWLQKSVMYLSFSDNNLFNPFPLSFCDKGNTLMHLDLSNNKFFGTLPISLTNCTALISLNLANNNLSGTLPYELKFMKNLSYLQLNGNHFNGPFPSFIQELQDLQVLNLGNNRFEKEIPQSIGYLHNLHILVLRFNYFNGSIPREILNLGNLQYIDLSNNKLLGDIPNELQGLKMLTQRSRGDRVPIARLISFMYSGVELNVVTKGQSYEFPDVFNDISGIDFSHNLLTGKIPAEIGLLEGLYMLNFSHNYLSGEIPTSIGGMRDLESLDLSFNNLNGEIPFTLTTLDFLSVLNLSYNNLSGRIPKVSHFDTLSPDGSAYVGNKFLCGAPGGLDCSNNGSSSVEVVEVGDKKEDFLLYGLVVLGYGVGLWGFFLVLYLVNETWSRRYWSTINKIVLRIMQCV